MPLYDVKCSEGHVEEIYKGMTDGYPACSKCGKPTEQVFGGKSFEDVEDFKPYFDENLDVYIKSRRHRVEEMRRQGVREGRGDMDSHVIEGARRWADTLRKEGKPLPARLKEQLRERAMR